MVRRRGDSFPQNLTGRLRTMIGLLTGQRTSSVEYFRKCRTRHQQQSKELTLHRLASSDYLANGRGRRERTTTWETSVARRDRGMTEGSSGRTGNGTLGGSAGPRWEPHLPACQPEVNEARQRRQSHEHGISGSGPPCLLIRHTEGNCSVSPPFFTGAIGSNDGQK